MTVVAPSVHDQVSALFDRAIVQIKIIVGCKTLHRLFCKVSVGHGMTDSDGLLAQFLENVRNTS